MSTVPDLIGKWPSVSEWARDLGLKRESHGTLMKMRGSIPVAYWQRMIEAAQARDIEGVTLEALAEAHTNKARTPACPEVAQTRSPSAKASAKSAGEQGEFVKPLRCLSPHRSSVLATEGQSR